MRRQALSPGLGKGWTDHVVGELMRARDPAVLLIWCLALAACVSEPGRPKSTVSAAVVPAPAPAPPRPKRLLPQFECSFGTGSDMIYRTYVLQSGTLVEQGPPRVSYKIVSDDGETITARRKGRGSDGPTVITIGLRRHDASLSQGRPGNSDTAPLQGTCAQSG